MTYTKGITVCLENNNEFFIDMPLPIERCIRETADGLVNNIKSLIVHKVSDEGLFKACMEAQAGFNIKNISIVDRLDRNIMFIDNIMETNRNFIFRNRVFVESDSRDFAQRTQKAFFSQIANSAGLVESILKLKGFDTINNDENVVTILIDDSYDNITALKEAAEKLNRMYLRDEENRLVKVKIQPP